MADTLVPALSDINLTLTGSVPWLPYIAGLRMVGPFTLAPFMGDVHPTYTLVVHLKFR